jgi:uncharacterized small protein (DUF1192 family)
VKRTDWPFRPFFNIILKMLLEDDNPAGSRPAKPKNLDPLSVAELQEYVEALKVEIKRAEGEITRKSSTRAAADAFFQVRK